ncbi:MAG: penicillin-binding protein activator [Planctomycetes bacterium]|nr:penicillin-binding protein activator [Planctomycetota bacterium]
MRLSNAIQRHFGAIRLVAATTVIAGMFAACGTSGGGGPGGPGFTSATGSGVKVALLLPTSAGGSTPAIAKALKQAGELALFDFDNPNVTLVPKDTRGTPDGARQAAESAVQEGAELIIGPLFAQEVTAVAPIARQAGIPVLAFSSDERVAGNGVYLLSFVAGRDVQRIVTYALSRGKRNFAVLVPQSPYGRIAENAFARAVSAGGGVAAVRAVFPPGDSNAMLGPVRQITNAVKGGQKIDALFLPAGREELPSISPLLASSGLTSAQVQFLGTGQWDFPNIGTEKAVIGGWYPAPDPKGWASFSARYAKTYGSPPPRIASLAYDAVSLAVSLSQGPQGQRYTAAQLTRGSGFQGVDGLFRLMTDGTSERGLAILEVREYGPQVIDPAPSSFTNAQSSY